MKRRHLILGNGPAGVVAAETLARYAPKHKCKRFLALVVAW